MPFAFIFTWLGNLLGGPFAKAAVDAYKAKLESQNSKDAKTAEIVQRELAVEQREAELNQQVVLAEQGRWYTALPRPLFAFAVVIYVWKLFVIDKVIGPGCIWWTSMCWKGTTDPLSPEMSTWAMVIITAYFGGRTIEKVARILAVRR